MSAELAKQLWPELRNAVQPAPLPRASGSVHFDSKRDWQALVSKVEAGTFRLRAPAVSPAGLCGPFFGQGECLSPIFETDVSYYDPSIEPQDGDVVLVQYDPAKARRTEEYVRADPRLLAMHGAGPVNLVSKFLRRFRHDWVIQCRDGVSFLHDRARGETHRVLGVLRYVERNGVPLYGCGVVAHQIDPEAATSTYTETLASYSDVSDAGDVVILSTDSLGNTSGAGIVEVTECTVYTTATLDVEGNSGGLIGLTRWVDGIPGGSGNDETVVAPSAVTRVTLQQQFDVATGEEWFVALMASSNGSTGMDLSNIRVEVNVIRR